MNTHTPPPPPISSEILNFELICCFWAFFHFLLYSPGSVAKDNGKLLYRPEMIYVDETRGDMKRL